MRSSRRNHHSAIVGVVAALSASCRRGSPLHAVIITPLRAEHDAAPHALPDGYRDADNAPLPGTALPDASAARVPGPLRIQPRHTTITTSGYPHGVLFTVENLRDQPVVVRSVRAAQLGGVALRVQDVHDTRWQSRNPPFTLTPRESLDVWVEVEPPAPPATSEPFFITVWFTADGIAHRATAHVSRAIRDPIRLPR